MNNNIEIIKLLIEILTLLVIIIALSYNYKQMKAARLQADSALRQADSALRQTDSTLRQTELLNKSLECSTYVDFESSLFELSKLLIQNPDVRPYLYDDVKMPEKGDLMYNLVVSFAVFYLDFFDHVLTMEQLSPEGTKWDESKWTAWIKDMFKCSPSLRQVHAEEKHWYNDRLITIIDIVKNEIKETRSSRI